MITFFGNPYQKVFAVQTEKEISDETISKLNWLFGGVESINKDSIDGDFVGPRAAMITPWSTNAVEITQNMGVKGILRIEEFVSINPDKSDFDPMLQQRFSGLDQELYTINMSLKRF